MLVAACGLQKNVPNTKFEQNTGNIVENRISENEEDDEVCGPLPLAVALCEWKPGRF